MQVSLLACALCMNPVQAAGLGKLTVLSVLGQPLQAEIELAPVSINESGPLVARLADADTYLDANIELNPILSSLIFAIVQRGAAQLIRITSSKPIDEPFLDMLIKLSWTNGSLLREYTFLLDTASDNGQVHTAIAPGFDVITPTAATALPTAAPALPATTLAAPAPGAASSTQHEVQRGETLSQIALAVKPADISLDLMLLALYRANPDAFIEHNINRLRSGQIMAIPSLEALRASSTDAASAARTLVLAHAADFAAYRKRLAGQLALSAPEQVLPSGQSAAGKISATVTEPASRLTTAPDRLKLSTAASGKAAGTVKSKTQSAALEDAIAKDQQISDDQARIKELENNVGDLEKLMSVKIKTMLSPQAPPQSAAASLATTGAQTAPSALPWFNQLQFNQFVQMLTENAIASVTVLFALLVGAFVAVRRRSGLKATRLNQTARIDVQDAVDAKAMDRLEPQLLEAEVDVKMNQAISISNSAAMAVDVDPMLEQSLESPDPLAQADVYLAYGRDEAAEDILKQALQVAPEQLAVRLKLLEIYAKYKDAELFETQAGPLYSQTKGLGEMWVRAAALGRAIDPENGLYALPLATVATKFVAPAVAAEPTAPQQTPEPLSVSASINRVAQIDADVIHEREPMTQEEALFDLHFDLPFEPPHAHAHLLDSTLLEADEVEAPPEPEHRPVIIVAPVFDLSVINLDIKPRRPMAATPAPLHQADEQSIVLARQMESKLDLASAYQEIGDKNGARELLDEVIDAGSLEQVAQARLRMQQLA